jgi:hypothetical protein
MAVTVLGRAVDAVAISRTITGLVENLAEALLQLQGAYRERGGGKTELDA